jgi:RimJ/RimL family protein N-acetyltransferase
MEPFPLLRTERMVLREFTPEDAPELRQIAQPWEVARTMLHLPHPYDEGAAEEWIAGLRPMFESGTGTTFAIVLREGSTLLGTVSLYTSAPDGSGVLGFWISDCRIGITATLPRQSRRWFATASRSAAYAACGPTTSGATRPRGGS